jgi:hypothetical protein
MLLFAFGSRLSVRTEFIQETSLLPLLMVSDPDQNTWACSFPVKKWGYIFKTYKFCRIFIKISLVVHILLHFRALWVHAEYGSNVPIFQVGLP